MPYGTLDNMTPLAEKRRANLISIIYLGLIVTLFYLFMKYAFGLFAPFLFAGFTAIVLQKPVNAINKKTKIKKSAISIVLVVLLIIVLAGIATGIGMSLVSTLKSFVAYIMKKFDSIPAVINTAETWMTNAVGILPEKLEGTALTKISAFADNLREYFASGKGIQNALTDYGIMDKLSNTSVNISSIASPVVAVVSAIPHLLVGTLIYFIASFFLTSDYDNFVKILKGMMKKETVEKVTAAKKVTFTSLGRMGKSYATILLITFTEVTIGLLLLKIIGFYEQEIPFILIIAAGTALLDILPVFGTGTVLIPWGIYSLTIGSNIPMGIGLLIIYVIITVIRQVIEPKLVGANLDIHPIFTLMGMYIGVETIGFIGLFAVPICIVVLKMLNRDGIIHLWGEERKLATVEDLPPAQPPIIKQIIDSVTVDRSKTYEPHTAKAEKTSEKTEKTNEENKAKNADKTQK